MKVWILFTLHNTMIVMIDNTSLEIVLTKLGYNLKKHFQAKYGANIFEFLVQILVFLCVGKS